MDYLATADEFVMHPIGDNFLAGIHGTSGWTNREVDFIQSASTTHPPACHFGARRRNRVAWIFPETSKQMVTDPSHADGNFPPLLHCSFHSWRYGSGQL